MFNNVTSTTTLTNDEDNVHVAPSLLDQLLREYDLESAFKEAKQNIVDTNEQTISLMNQVVGQQTFSSMGQMSTVKIEDCYHAPIQ